MIVNLSNFPKMIADPTTNEQKIMDWKKNFTEELKKKKVLLETKIKNDDPNASTTWAAIGSLIFIEEVLG